MSINFKFYSGFSSSDSAGKDGTYLYSENINSTNPEYIEISPKTQTLVTTNEKIDFIIFQKNKETFNFVSGYKIFNQNNQKVYDHTDGITNFNGYNPGSSRGKISLAVNIFGGNNTFLVFAPGIDKSQNKFTSAGFFSLGLTDSEKIRGFFNSSLAYEKNIDVLDKPGFGFIFLANGSIVRYNYVNHNLLKSEGIGAISLKDNSSGLKVFSKEGNLVLLSTTKQNKAAEVSEVYALDLDIFSAKSYSGIDYIFSLQGLFFLNGILASPIAYTNNSSYLDFKKFDFLGNLKWGYVKNDKFIYSITKTKKGFDLNVLGSSAVGSPINFSSIISKENWQEVSSMIEYKEGVLISYKDKNGSYGIDYFSFKNEEKNEKGYLITKEYVGDGQIFLKKAKSLKFFCDKLKSGQYLKIFASINNGEFEEVKTLTSEDRWKNGFFEVLSFNKEFHKIVFKLELCGDFKLYDFIFLDDKIK